MDWKANVTRNVDLKWFETSWGCQSCPGIGLLWGQHCEIWRVSILYRWEWIRFVSTMWRSGCSIVMRLWRVSLLTIPPTGALAPVTCCFFMLFWKRWSKNGQVMVNPAAYIHQCKQSKYLIQRCLCQEACCLFHGHWAAIPMDVSILSNPMNLSRFTAGYPPYVSYLKQP